MEVPILKQGDVLIASVQSALSDADLLSLRDRLLDWTCTHRSQGVVVDVTSLDVVDSFACRALRNLAQALRLEGAETVIVGIQPDVAFAMVQLGLSLEDVSAGLDLEDGLELLRRRSMRRESHAG